MRLSSTTPEAARRRASSISASHGLERNRPRNDGIAQNVHAWSHPSATRRYAVCRGVSAWRSHSGRKGTVAEPTSTRAPPPEAAPPPPPPPLPPLPSEACSAPASSPYRSKPTTRSASGSSAASSAAYRCAMQPVTTTRFDVLPALCAAASMMAEIDSAFASSTNAHVFTTMASASSWFVVMSKPSRNRSPSMTSPGKVRTAACGKERRTIHNVLGAAEAHHADLRTFGAPFGGEQRRVHCCASTVNTAPRAHTSARQCGVLKHCGVRQIEESRTTFGR